jgi:predicted glycogen debranching enzyme
MNEVLRRMPWGVGEARASLLTREWLVTNGLGGYASGTIAGVATRRYHGLLIAALPGSLGRVVMLNHLSEQLRLPNGTRVILGGAERDDGLLEMPGAGYLTEFRLEMGLPVICYEVNGFAIEKRLLMPHGQNTIHIHYRLVKGNGTLRLKLLPAVHFRSHDGPLNQAPGTPHVLKIVEDCIEVTHPPADERYAQSEPPRLPPLRLLLRGQRTAFTVEGKHLRALRYREEASRGYDSLGDLWSPGHFRCDLSSECDSTLIASTESWETIRALKPEEARTAALERRRRLIHQAATGRDAGPTGMAAELVLAADQFLVLPMGRAEEAAQARAAGDEERTIIAGYHWFTDWGRDTMISLDGLTLATGRHREAGSILRTFANYIRDGLIPNLFPEGKSEGLYNTVDATLWYFHALSRYLKATDDRATLRLLLPRLLDIVEHHLAGTHYGIGVDAADGLLRQGMPGYQLTWMDAKVDDWVVTPRHGKAVEINALWYNALRLLEDWVRAEPDYAVSSNRGRGSGLLPHGAAAANVLAEHAERAYASFNARFWYEHGGYLFDVVDGEPGNNTACRPNQVFAIALPHAVLEQRRWQPVLEVVRAKLVTPVGLRSLAPDHLEYQPRYEGDLRSRDAAYHQGTVWAWLIGPFIDAWLKVYPEDYPGAAQFLEGFRAHLGEAGMGSISEIFDPEPPFTPRGCIAQAWSVAEVLRCWVRLAEQGAWPG